MPLHTNFVVIRLPSNPLKANNGRTVPKSIVTIVATIKIKKLVEK